MPLTDRICGYPSAAVCIHLLPSPLAYIERYSPNRYLSELHRNGHKFKKKTTILQNRHWCNVSLLSVLQRQRSQFVWKSADTKVIYPHHHFKNDETANENTGGHFTRTFTMIPGMRP
jgi:hypothetical protein